MRDPYPHQMDALLYCQEHRHAALFLEMRLGKTKVAINALQYHGTNLVVAPLSVLYTWQAELLAEGIDPEKAVLLEGPVQNRLNTAEACLALEGTKGNEWEEPFWCLTNYETLRLAPAIATLPWYGVVLDESSKIRNPGRRVRDSKQGGYRRAGQTTDVCLAGFRNVQRRFILTGLPAPESPLDYFNQLAFLDGTFMGCSNFWQFRAKYFILIERAYKWYPRKGVREKIREEIQARCFVLNRQQVGMANQRIYETREVEPSPDQVRLLKQAKREFAVTVNGETRKTQWAIVVANWMNQISGGTLANTVVGEGKTKELVDLLTGELADQQVVVWFRFNSELWAVRSAVMAKGIRCELVLGEVPPEERNRWCQQFSKGEFTVLLVQLKCGKFGLDLSAASTAIYYSNGFSHEDRAQSEDRIEHPRKREPLLFVDLVTRGSTDRTVLSLLKQKVSAGKFFYEKVLGSI